MTTTEHLHTTKYPSMTTAYDYRDTTQWIPFMFGPQQLEELTQRYLTEQPYHESPSPTEIRSENDHTHRMQSIQNPTRTIRPDTFKPTPEPKKPPTTSSEYFVYNVKDSLFWLLFIGAHGLSEYDRNEFNCGKRIIEQKQTLIQTVFKMSNTQIRKQTGRPLTKLHVADLISSLQTAPRITTDMFPLFAIHFQTDIFVFDRACGTYCEYNYITEVEDEEEVQMPIILYKKGHTFSVELDPKKCIESDDMDTFVKVDSVGGTIGPVGNYTKQQLVSIWTKLNTFIDRTNNRTNGTNGTNKEMKKENNAILLEKQTKQQIYEQIISFGHTTEQQNH